MPRLSNTKLQPIISENESIGSRIAKIRKKRCLTQRELADKIGISRSMIGDYEKNRSRIYDEMLARIAIALSTSIDGIIGLKHFSNEEDETSLRFMKRIKQIEKLPAAKQKTILSSLDMMIDSASK
jgi:transcriptional regulator with XRE-family HTH domain